MIYRVFNNYSNYLKNDFFQKLPTRQKFYAIAAIALSILLIRYCSVKFVRAWDWETKKLNEADDLFRKAEKYLPKKPELAFKYFLKAAQMNHIQAQVELGKLFKNGIGITKNEKEAFEWFNRAATAGNIQGQFNLSGCYLKGIGTPKDIIEGFKWMKQAAESGYTEALIFLWAHYNEHKHAAEGLKWLKKAAEGGSVSSQFLLGLNYLVGVSRNEKEGLKWLTEAAESNSIDALRWLARNYHKAGGNDEEVFKLYFKAAKLGDKFSQNKIADFYMRGQIVETDLKEAFLWSCKAAEGGSKLAKTRLENFDL